jgi:hypothetical protein
LGAVGAPVGTAVGGKVGVAVVGARVGPAVGGKVGAGEIPHVPHALRQDRSIALPSAQSTEAVVRLYDQHTGSSTNPSQHCAWDGETLGAPVGARVVGDVGVAVGNALGARDVGVSVGSDVGVCVGVAVGLLVGAPVGACVGGHVPHRMGHSVGTLGRMQLPAVKSVHMLPSVAPPHLAVGCASETPATTAIAARMRITSLQR